MKAVDNWRAWLLVATPGVDVLPKPEVLVLLVRAAVVVVVFAVKDGAGPVGSVSDTGIDTGVAGGPIVAIIEAVVRR